MIQSIRSSKISKVVASYLALQLLLQMFQPTAMWALTGGPKQPEFNSFTPIGTSDMVDLSSGNFSYNIPIMDVGGYPLNLAYQSGVTMDQEASWVGLGWNLNVGQINRQVRGIPDDFKGDEMVYENNMKENVTVGVGVSVDVQVFGLERDENVGGSGESGSSNSSTGANNSSEDTGNVANVAENIGTISLGAKINYNNYTGVSFFPTFGLSFDVSESVAAGISLEGNAMDGPTVSPSVSLKGGLEDRSKKSAYDGSLNMGVSYNSTRGLSDFSISTSFTRSQLNEVEYEYADGTITEGTERGKALGSGSASGRISFSKPTMTPRKRTAYKDLAGTFSFSVGSSVQGTDFEGEISATAAFQQIKDKRKVEKAYGYDFTGFASAEDVIDYNRENDQVISKSLKALPVTNYTYDTYSVQAQGIGGQFRPYRSQVGHIYDEYVLDASHNFSLGVELEGGVGFHVGGNFTGIQVESSTGVWDTRARSRFIQNREDSEEVLGYEPVYYKYVGEHRIDQDLSLYEEELGGDSPIEMKISGSRFNKNAIPQYSKKVYNTQTDASGRQIEGVPSYEDLGIINNKLKRSRDFRNQSIQKISRGDLPNFYSNEYIEPWKERNNHGKDHHTAEVRVLKPDGSTYIFGETAYNLDKQETTFALRSGSEGDCTTGLVNYNSGDNSSSNSNGRDNFFNNTITPEYAHSYLSVSYTHLTLPTIYSV